MLRQIAVGKALRELQREIEKGYGLGYKVKITGVIVDVEPPETTTSKHQVVLRVHNAIGEPNS
jgi:hypothetical protein